MDPHSIPQIKPHADICMICRYLQKCELLLRIAIAAVTSKARHTVWWDTCHLLRIKIRYGALNVLAEQFAIIAPCGKYPMTTVHARQREQFKGHGPQIIASSRMCGDARSATNDEIVPGLVSRYFVGATCHSVSATEKLTRSPMRVKHAAACCYVLTHQWPSRYNTKS